MAPPSPTVASWELSLRIRQRREQLGMSVGEITDLLGFSRNYWSAVENDRTLLSTEKLRLLADAFELGADEKDELLSLREAARQRGWWARYSALFSTETLRYFGMEHGAESVRSYEPALVPGLLQTEEYMRALMRTNALFLRLTEIDQRVEVQLHRQQRLTDDRPLRLIAVLSEAALLQQIGGPDVLRRQLQQLARTIETQADTVDVRVLPFTSQGCAILGTSTLYVLDFTSPRLPALTWYESVTSSGIVEDENHVRDAHLAHAEAWKLTLGREDSLDLIKQRAKELT